MYNNKIGNWINYKLFLLLIRIWYENIIDIIKYILKGYLLIWFIGYWMDDEVNSVGFLYVRKVKNLVLVKFIGLDDLLLVGIKSLFI